MDHRRILSQFFAALLLGVASLSARADGVILDPDPLATVDGTVGLANEVFASGVVRSSAGNLSYQASFGSDGEFSVTARAEATLSLSFDMNNFQSAPGATLNQYVYSQPQLTEDEVRTIDLRRGSGRVSGSVNVIGGTLATFNMRAQAYDYSVPERFTGNVTVSSPPYVALQPIAPLSSTRVNGSVTVAADAGCDVSRSLPTQYVNVAADSVVYVEWDIDVSDANCEVDVGAFQQTIEVTGLENTNADAVERSRHVSFYGPVNASRSLSPGESVFSVSDIPVGSYWTYTSLYFHAPYDRLFEPSQRVDINAGELTTRNRSFALGTAHGSIDLVGAWGTQDIYYSQVRAIREDIASFAYDYLDTTTGAVDFVVESGDSLIDYAYFYDYGYDPDTGKSSNWYTYQYRYGDSRIPLTVAEGERVDFGSLEIDTSVTSVVFQVAQPEGQPEALIERLQVYGTAYKRDPDTNAQLFRSDLNQNDYLVPTSQYSMRIRGLPGTYAMVATGYGTDGRQYRANFELVLGAPENTTVGSDVGLEFQGEDGESIGGLTFENVVSAGETTFSEVSLGPGAPRNFKIFQTGGQPQYFDISTTAQFDGLVEVCINYRDEDVDNPEKEADMALAHYDDSTDTWEVITSEGYPDTINNVICGTTASFSIFAILEVDIVDADNDGIVDDLDNCPQTPNADQADLDADGIGDACDVDSDGDGFTNDADLCPGFYALENGDLDGDGVGDPCDYDVDGDSVANAGDNCPLVANPDQVDFDGDAIGDACDSDDDGDTFADAIDTCPGTALGTLIDSEGCSSDQRFELYCPSDGVYRNHGMYVSCVAREARRQADLGLIGSAQEGAIVSTAAKTETGK